MTLLPEVERRLVDGARRYHRRRARIARAAPLLAIAAAVPLIAVGAGALSGESEREAAAPTPAPTLEQLAAGAGCTLTHPPFEGSDHVARSMQSDDYRSNPPTSGDHTPEWAEDGVYGRRDAPPLGQLVHALEHGRIHLQYRHDAPPEQVAALERLFAENGGHHMLLSENLTMMPAPVAATAWGHSLTCRDTSPKAIAAMRAFRDRYMDKGPELVP